MSLSWSALHAQLLASTNRVEAIRIYEHIRNAAGDALPPGDVSSLLAFLHGSDDDAESKNRALYALVHAGQAEPAWAEVSGTLLLLALWPGLDAVRSRLRRRFPDERKLLDAELVGRMSVAIHDCDLTQVNRIAATLLRNVERDV